MKHVLFVLLAMSISSVGFSAAAPSSSSARAGKAGNVESYRFHLEEIIATLKATKKSKPSQVKEVMKQIFKKHNLGEVPESFLDSMADALIIDSKPAFREAFLSLIALRDPSLRQSTKPEEASQLNDNIDAAGKLGNLALALGQAVEKPVTTDALNNVCSRLFKDSMLKGEELTKWKKVFDTANEIRSYDQKISPETAFEMALELVTGKKGQELTTLIEELRRCT